MWPDLRFGVSASDRERPLVTGVNGPLMARRTAAWPALRAVLCPSPSSSIATSRTPLGCRARIIARACSMAVMSCQVRLPVTRSRNGWPMSRHLLYLRTTSPGCPAQPRLGPSALCRGWPTPGPGRLRPRPCLLTGLSAEAPGSSVASRVRSPGIVRCACCPAVTVTLDAGGAGHGHSAGHPRIRPLLCQVSHLAR